MDGLCSPKPHRSEKWAGSRAILGAVGPALLSLLHQGLVGEDGLELVAADGHHEHAEEDGLQHEDHRVEDAGLLDLE